MPGPIFIVLFLLVAGGLIAWSIKAAAKRREELSAWAASRGLSFSQDKVRSFHKQYPDLRCLHRGHTRFAHNIMCGRMQGFDVEALDYHYATGSGKNRRTHRFSAVIVASPVPLRKLDVRRENFFDKVGAFFGADDIDFESAEFSDRYRVKADDKRWAFDVIHARMIEYLLQGPDRAFAFDTERVIVWHSRCFDAADFDAAFEHARRILDLLPDYLVRQQTESDREP